MAIGVMAIPAIGMFLCGASSVTSNSRWGNPLGCPYYPNLHAPHCVPVMPHERQLRP